MNLVSTHERKPSLGGFTFNGIGAEESTSNILPAGIHHCKYCHSQRHFMVSEIKLKFKVVFVPIASIKTTYAVVCSVCGNGYYIDEIQRDALIHHGAKAEVKDDRLVIVPSSSPSPVQETPPTQTPPPLTRQAKTVCPRCGKNQPEAGNFCVFCGTPI